MTRIAQFTLGLFLINRVQYIEVLAIRWISECPSHKFVRVDFIGSIPKAG